MSLYLIVDNRNEHLRQRLADIYAHLLSQGQYHRRRLLRKCHTVLEFAVYQRFVHCRHREIVHRTCLRAEVAEQLIHKEWSDRCAQQSHALKHLVQSSVGGQFVLAHTISPETLLIKTDVPVTQIVTHEILDESTRESDVVILVSSLHLLAQGIETAHNPLVEHRTRTHLDSRPARVEFVDIGIKGENRIRVVEGSEELAANLVHPGLVELQVIPRLCVREHIPAKGIGAIGIESLERIHCIAKSLRHLLTLLIEYQSVRNHALESRSAAYHSMDGVQRIEPSASLVHTLCDEVGGRAEVGTVQTTKTSLCVRHGAAVEPHVDKVALALHLVTALADEENLVYIRAVKIYLVVISLRHIFRVEAFFGQWVTAHKTGSYRLFDLCVELLDRAYALLFLTVFGTPNRKRRAPIAASGQVPILYVLEPLAKSSGTRSFRLPDYVLVKFHHLLAHCCSLDEPRIKRVVKNRLVCSPAMRICVYVFFYLECLVLALEHHADVDIKRRSVRCEGAVVGVLHITACPLRIFRNVHAILHVFRIQVLNAIETAARIYLRLHISVLVHHIKSRNSGSLGHLRIVGTEGRSDVNYTGSALLGGDIVAKYHAESAFARIKPRNELLVAQSLELAALEGARQDLIRDLVVKPAVYQRLGQYINGRLSGIWVRALHTDIVDVRIHTKSGVTRKGPRSGSPSEEILIFLTHNLKLHAASGVLHVAVASRLIQLVRAQAGSRCRAVRLNGLTLIEIALTVDVLQKIPKGLDITVIISDVRVVHIYPVTDPVGKVTPLSGIFHNLFTAHLVILGYAYLSSDIFLSDTQLLLHTELHRQSVGVPSRTTAHQITALRLVTTDGILYTAGHHVMDTGHTISTWRSLEENKLRRTLPQLERLSECTFFFPLFEHLVTGGYQIQPFILFECHFFYLFLNLQI